MSESTPSKATSWRGGISVALIVTMAGVLFGQMRLIAQQNHQLMIENQRIEIELDNRKTTFDVHVAQVVDKLDSGFPLVTGADYRVLNIQDELKGPIMGALVRQLKDDRFYVQLNGLLGISAMVPKSNRMENFAPMVVPAVIPTLKDQRLRNLAMHVLRQYQGQAAAAAPIVLETCDAASWDSVTSSIENARGMNPKCDYLPLLTRHIQQSEDNWQKTLARLQAGFTNQELLDAYQAASKQAEDEELQRRYAGITRYLKDQPPLGTPSPARDVEEYVP